MYNVIRKNAFSYAKNNVLFFHKTYIYLNKVKQNNHIDTTVYDTSALLYSFENQVQFMSTFYVSWAFEDE